MTRQSLEAIRRVFTIEQPRATEQESRQHLVQFARAGNEQTLREQAARGGAVPTVTQYANTPGNVNLDSVKLPGPIVFIYDYRTEIVQFALDALRQASPVQSGRYRNSHVILLNGTQVTAIPQTLKETDIVTLTNPVPYARRIEIGKTKSGRDFVLNVPNRIYERVAKRQLLPKFRNVADIQFGYLELTGAYAIKGALPSHYIAKGGTRRKRRQAKDKAIQAPAIFIRSVQTRAV